MRHHLVEQTVYIKDALRGIRFAVRQGHEALKERAPRHLPSPASSIALSTLGEIETVAKSIESQVHRIAKAVLGASPYKLSGLTEAMSSVRPAHEFSESYYHLMKLLLKRYGVVEVFMSQRGFEQAFAEADRSGTVLSFASRLVISIARHQLKLSGISVRRPDMLHHDLQRLAAFATMVAMLADVGPQERIEVAYSAAELVFARRETIANALTKEDFQQTLTLLGTMSAHV